MKKYQYMIAAACVLVGAAGFAGVYAMNQAEQKQQQGIVQNQQESETEQEQNLQVGTNTENMDSTQVADKEPDVKIEPSESEQPTEENEIAQKDSQTEQNKNEAQVDHIQEEVLHFDKNAKLMWPIESDVLLDYSMDATILFPTLQQYKYHSAMVFSAKVNDKVYFIAKGKITNIETNEETGCTVTQDLGDGYTAKYGQLKELTFKVGETVEAGQVVGYVSEPTKYYSVEGSNVYLQLLKDGKPIDPKTVLPQE